MALVPRYHPSLTKCDLRRIARYEDFPAGFKTYVEFIEHETGVPVKIISVGPDRSETVVR